MKRYDGRAWNDLRPVTITLGAQQFAEGSALIEVGKTRVLCAVSVEDRVPMFLKGSGRGWVTAEYAMLPRATLTRTPRDSIQGKISGRNQEIQRLIGRSLRAVVNMEALGERTLTVDCDVLQADGGTRTASITGAYVALYQAFTRLSKMGVIKEVPMDKAVAATSVGVVAANRYLDLCYDEDSIAEVDFNVVMTNQGDFVEVQGTAEGKPFSKETMGHLMALAEKGINELFTVQEKALEEIKGK
jgi:ribonuclease PH